MFNHEKNLDRAWIWFSIVSIFTALPGCTPISDSNWSNSSVVGVWTREEDAYAGWVIEITEAEPGEYEARSVWVPNSPRELYSFRIGEKKIRGMKQRSANAYTLESLLRLEDGTPEYGTQEATLATPDRLILIEDNPAGRIGDKQIWRRVGRGDIENAYADYGRGEIAAEREFFTEASAAYKQAAQRLLKERDLQAHSDLVNDLSWRIATTKHDAIHDPELALHFVSVLGDFFNHVDTAAAIYAANGDFDRAIELQKQAIAEVQSEEAPAVYLRSMGLNDKNFVLQFGVGMMLGKYKTQFEQRLKLYENRQPYRI